MSKCPSCGANFSEIGSVCEYCGHVKTENLKKVDSKKDITFSESMTIIEDNLNALHKIHPPSGINTLSRIFRIILAIHTLGISLIFWKKPKKNFDEKTYKELKSIVKRNILKLKVLYSGNNQLLNLIKIAEDELNKIDSTIKRGKVYRTIAISLVSIFYAYLLFFQE